MKIDKSNVDVLKENAQMDIVNARKTISVAIANVHVYYGSTGCGVFKWGIQNQKDFCKNINIPKGNY